MPVKRLIERVSTPFAGASVDREKGLIRGVKLCGDSSVNGRDYPPEVFRRDAWKYEGAAIYADHGQERSVDRKLGWIASPRVDADGTPRGDAHLLKTHPLYERVMEAAERNPALFGFSHVALCETSVSADGRERVNELRAIESVDLVAEPATTAGLFESRDRAGSRSDVRLTETRTRFAMPVRIRELAAWVARHPLSTTRQIIAMKRLTEMDAGAIGEEPVMDAMPADDAEPMDAITGGFKAAIGCVIEKALAGEMDAAAALKKIKTLLAAHSDATAEESAATDPEPAVDATEARQASQPVRERPTSYSRHQVARLSETTDQANIIPQDGAGFARWVTE